MAKRPSKSDLIAALSNFIAHNKGLPVFVGIGLAIVGLALDLVPGLASDVSFWGWLVRNHLFLYLGVIVGLVGILIGDAL
jgi:hypothetical protein